MPYPFCGQDEILALLARAAAAPAGAYGFFGPEHLGKRRLAEGFARRLLGHPEPVSLDAHPDFAVLDAAADGSIETVRAFLGRMHHTAARGGRRLFLVDHAESLNASGFNALLKDVEEPRPGTIFLFVSSRPAALPATLHSRLVPLRVREVPADVLGAWAKAAFSAPEAWIAEAHGRPGLLVRRAEQPEWWDGLVRHARRLLAAYAEPTVGPLVAALDEWQRAADAQERPEQSWRILLFLLANEAAAGLRSETVAASFGQAVATAWRCLGGPIPPRVAFEWHRLQRDGGSAPASSRTLREWAGGAGS